MYSVRTHTCKHTCLYVYHAYKRMHTHTHTRMHTHSQSDSRLLAIGSFAEKARFQYLKYKKEGGQWHRTTAELYLTLGTKVSKYLRSCNRPTPIFFFFQIAKGFKRTGKNAFAHSKLLFA